MRKITIYKFSFHFRLFYTADLISIPDPPERNEDGTREIIKNTSRNTLQNDNKPLLNVLNTTSQNFENSCEEADVSRSTFQDNTTHFENDITPLDFGIPNNKEFG